RRCDTLQEKGNLCRAPRLPARAAWGSHTTAGGPSRITMTSPMYAKGVEPVPGFRLLEPLGRGGFGEVWKAEAPGGTQAAVKVISLSNNEGFKEFRAIRLVKRLRHPHLVPIIAFWMKDSKGNLID